MTRLRTILPAVTLGLTAALGIVGCSAGQVTQTDSVEPAVNGNRGQVGSLALRDVLVAYPESGKYVEGESAPLRLTIVNTGPDADRLVKVTSPVSGTEAVLMGDPSLPGRTALHVVVPDQLPEAESTESSAPSEPAQPTSPSAPPSESSESPESPESTTQTTPVPTESEEPEVVGEMSVVLTDLLMELPFGRNFPVTFVFEKAGQITIDLPIGAPETPRAPAPEAEGEGGH